MTHDPQNHMSAPAPEAGDESLLTWDEICQTADFRGRWVALDGCRYDDITGRATAGQVVDVDESLTDLCQRVRDADLRSCAILFCDESGTTSSAH